LDDGDEVVIFNPVTCQTHLLNRSAADLLAALDEDPTLAAESASGGKATEALSPGEWERLATLRRDLRFLGLIID
jgi:hypothetical protein